MHNYSNKATNAEYSRKIRGKRVVLKEQKKAD